jgi:HK97 family phage major capsid protein
MSDELNMTHTQAVHRLKDIEDEMTRLSGKADKDGQLSPEDEEAWDGYVRETATLDEYRKGLERKAEMKAVAIRVAAADGARTGVRVERGSDNGELDRDILDPDSVEDRRFKNPWDLSEMRTFNRTPGEVGQELRSRALSAVEVMPGMTQARREGATRIIETYDNERGDIAQLALVSSMPAYVRAFAKGARGEMNSFTPEESQAVDRVRGLTRAMSLTDSAGGFLVPFQLDPTVIITSDGSRNDIRRAARTVVATGDVWNGVSAGATSWSWDAEAAEVSDDTSTFVQPTITVHKGAGFIPISIEAAMDEANVATEVGRLLSFGKETLEAQAFATGTGSGQPFGIVTALAGTASEINAAADDTFAIGDVYTLQGALPARYRAGASWLANNSIYNLVRRFDTSGGAGLWTYLGNDRPVELLGRPALEAEGMDGTVTTTGAVSNFILVFGDFENYVIADRIGMTVEFIPHLFHTSNNRPSGSRGWYAYFRVGADSVNDGAFRLLDVPSAA